MYVYSSDSEGNVIPSKALNPHITKYVNEVVEVTLDNGSVIRCTANHKFLMRSGCYVEAKDLSDGDSLMPLYRRYSDPSLKELKGYEMVNSRGKWVYTHRLVTKRFHRPLKMGEVRHHVNFDRLDNIPDNLEIMSWKDHTECHVKSKDERTKSLISDSVKSNKELMDKLSSGMAVKNRLKRELYPEWYNNQKISARKILTNINRSKEMRSRQTLS